jgi:dihydrofolate synthase / folylpolyglutamate synthase
LPSTGRSLAVCGILADKDAGGIAHVLRESFDAWWLVPTEGTRGATAEMLAQRIGAAITVPMVLAADIPAACADALANAVGNDRIVVFGSFHTVGPALDWLESQGLLPAAADPEYT